MGKEKWQRGSVISEGEVHFLVTSGALGTTSLAGTGSSDVWHPSRRGPRLGPLPRRARPGQPVGAALDHSSVSQAPRGLVTDRRQALESSDRSPARAERPAERRNPPGLAPSSPRGAGVRPPFAHG